MKIERFYEIIDNVKPLYGTEIYELKDLIERYPYFQQIIFLYLRALYKINSDLYQSELLRLSLFVNDRKALFYFVFEEDYKNLLAKTGKQEIGEDKTAILLNAFFDNDTDYEGKLEFELDSSTLAVTDYLSYLSVETKEEKKTADAPVAPPMKHQEIIDSFIEKNNEEEGFHIHIDRDKLSEPVAYIDESQESSELTDDMFFTETLAKIYIKQRKYEKAYKIIKHLSLNYPKKNIYFADQLSFLEKLIVNSKHKE